MDNDNCIKSFCKVCKKETIFLNIGSQEIEETITEEMEIKAKELRELYGTGWGVSYRHPKTSYSYNICVNCSKIETIIHQTKGWVNAYSTKEDAYPW